MKAPIFRLTLLAVCVLLPRIAFCFDLVPQLFTWKNAQGDQRQLLFPWDEEHFFSLKLYNKWNYRSNGPTELFLDPPAEQSSVRIQITKLDGLPPNMKDKEAQQFYAKLLLANVPKGATETGSVKLAGKFSGPDAVEAESFGLVYVLQARKRAIAMGFMHIPNTDFQFRYIVDAREEDFEEIHTQVRNTLGEVYTPTKTSIDDLRTGRVVFD